MKFAFDLDGVTYEYPEILREIMRCLKLGGNEVVILTGHYEGDSLEKDKKLLKIERFVYHDRIIEKPLAEMSSHKFKAQVCQTEDIDIFFEDNPETVKEVNKTKTVVMQVIQK